MEMEQFANMKDRKGNESLNTSQTFLWEKTHQDGGSHRNQSLQSAYKLAYLQAKKGQGLKCFVFGLQLVIARGNLRVVSQEISDDPRTSFLDALIQSLQGREGKKMRETSYFTSGIQITVFRGIVIAKPKWKSFAKCHGRG